MVNSYEQYMGTPMDISLHPDTNINKETVKKKTKGTDTGTNPLTDNYYQRDYSNDPWNKPFGSDGR